MRPSNDRKQKLECHGKDTDYQGVREFLHHPHGTEHIDVEDTLSCFNGGFDSGSRTDCIWRRRLSRCGSGCRVRVEDS